MEACLGRTADRGPLLLTLGAAGATLLVMLVVLAAPAFNACYGDDRGLLGCVRGLVDDKFDLGIQPASTATGPVVFETPTPAAPPVELHVAETLGARPVEPSRSLVAPAPEKPVAPPVAPQQVAAVPDVPAVEPDVSAEAPLPVVEPTVAVEPAMAPGLPVAAAQPAAADEPVAEPADALSFVPTDPEPVETAPMPEETAVADEPVVPASEPVTEVEPAVEPDAAPPAGAAVPDAPRIAVVAEPVEPAAVVEAPATELPVVAAEPDPAPMPSSLLPAEPADFTVAAIDPVVPPEPEPARPVLAPTIDAIEIDGDDNFIAGNGPAGATMRLYVDGIPVGVSPVEGGRWLVEGPDLLTEEQQVLKVEALDPLTGRVLGEATIAFEGPLGAEAAMAPEAPATIDRPAETAAAELPATDEPAEPPALVEAPVAVPPIRPVVPLRESPSVTILKPSGNPVFVTLATIGGTSSSSIVTLGADAPVVAEAAPPEEDEAGVPVLRAVAIGDPGAGRFVSGKAIIRRGDTLWDIAHRFYGRGIHYRTIFRANRELIARPGRIYPGQVFELPLVYDD